MMKQHYPEIYSENSLFFNDIDAMGDFTVSSESSLSLVVVVRDFDLNVFLLFWLEFTLLVS